MKRFYPWLVCSFLGLAFGSCSENTDFILQGELDNVGSDRILVVYDDPEPKLDTIYPQGGKFVYKLLPDTVQLFRLVDKAGNVIPVFADKGWRVMLSGSFTSPEVAGDGPNKDYQEFRSSIASLKDSAEVRRIAADFVRSHPGSFASAYLIDRYFAQIPSPDMEYIRKLVEPLNGNIKDSRILSIILQALSQKKEEDSDNVSYFSCRNRKGEYVSWVDKENDFTLINFWASWNGESIAERDSLESVVKSFPSRINFRILNLSLDYDREAWLAACKKDDAHWIEICDCTGWENSVLKQQNVTRLPANILVDRNRKILARNLYGEAFKNKILQLTKKD